MNETSHDEDMDDLNDLLANQMVDADPNTVRSAPTGRYTARQTDAPSQDSLNEMKDLGSLMSEDTSGVDLDSIETSFVDDQVPDSVEFDELDPEMLALDEYSQGTEESITDVATQEIQQEMFIDEHLEGPLSLVPLHNGEGTLDIPDITEGLDGSDLGPEIVPAEQPAESIDVHEETPVPAPTRRRRRTSEQVKADNEAAATTAQPNIEVSETVEVSEPEVTTPIDGSPTSTSDDEDEDPYIESVCYQIYRQIDALENAELRNLMPVTERDRKFYELGRARERRLG